MFELLGKTNIDFIGKRYYAYVLSGVLSLLGVITVIQVARGHANTGIDFAGGTAVQLQFEQPVQLDAARALLEREGFPDAELQQFTTGNKLLIRVKKQTTIQERTADRLVAAFKAGFESNPFVVDSTTEIGPTVGAKLQQDAVKAITIAMIGIIVYIALRFEFRFGVAAAVATFHDVLAVLGVMWLLDKEINLLIVTALLTIAGYSLTDTVVVFDRIRETLRTRRRDALPHVINQAVNQVLSRTIVVSMTTFLAALALFLFGGEVLHDFSLALLLGVAVGTYSSIFVASPLLLIWPGAEGKLLKRTA
ncbi:MAG: protein translocase subunit SecF [Nitrospirota bacterium]